jgi:hypothetical protein
LSRLEGANTFPLPLIFRGASSGHGVALIIDSWGGLARRQLQGILNPPHNPVRIPDTFGDGKGGALRFTDIDASDRTLSMIFDQGDV